MGTEIENAQITSTILGPQSGCMTFWVNLKGDGWGCGFGGRAVDAWDPTRKDRTDLTGYGMEAIRRILDMLEVDSWEQLPGKLVRVRMRRPGLGGEIVAIGHPIKDRWFSFSDIDDV